MNDTPRRPWIPPDAEPTARALHERVLSQDVTAFSELSHLVGDWLARAVRADWPLADEHQIIESCDDALMTYWREPSKYDPSRGAFVSYLIMSAKGDMKNLMARERRRTRGIVETGDSVADEGLSWEEWAETSSEESAEDVALLHFLEEEFAGRFARLFPDPVDQQFVQCIRDGVRDTARFAEVLGIEDQPLETQRQLVKRTRDRIMVAAKRHRAELLPESAPGSDD